MIVYKVYISFDKDDYDNFWDVLNGIEGCEEIKRTEHGICGDGPDYYDFFKFKSLDVAQRVQKKFAEIAAEDIAEGTPEWDEYIRKLEADETDMLFMHRLHVSGAIEEEEWDENEDNMSEIY